MITYNILPGTVDVSVTIRIIDSTDGTPETGVVFNTSGIDLQYRRELAASTAITEATLAALTTAHTDGGFLHIGNGYYRLDLPDAACATGAPGVLVHGTVTGMVVIGCYIQLEGFVNSVYTRIGAPAGASVSADIAVIEGQTDDIGAAGAGLTVLATQASVNTIDDFLDTEIAAILSDTNAILVDTTEIGVAGVGLTNINLPNQTMDITGNLSGSVGSVTGAVGSVTAGVTLAASAVQAIWDVLTAALTTVGSIGKLLVDNLNATITSRATPAEVKTQVVDALATDTYAEPGQGAPAATTTLAAKINYLYKNWRNKKTQTSTTFSIFADDAVTVDHKSTVSDDATTATRGEIATGP